MSATVVSPDCERLRRSKLTQASNDRERMLYYITVFISLPASSDCKVVPVLRQLGSSPVPPGTKPVAYFYTSPETSGHEKVQRKIIYLTQLLAISPVASGYPRTRPKYCTLSALVYDKQCHVQTMLEYRGIFATDTAPRQIEGSITRGVVCAGFLTVALVNVHEKTLGPGTVPSPRPPRTNKRRMHGRPRRDNKINPQLFSEEPTQRP